MLVVTIAIVVTAIPIIVYWFVGLARESKAKSAADYFIFSQHVTAQDYATTSVGYALQMAAIFLFADWGARYGLGALWTPIFWLLGFWLLYALLPLFLDYHSSGLITLHQYLRDRHHAGSSLQILAAIATLVGLWGAMMSEIDFTLALYDPILPSPQWRYPLLLSFLAAGAIFIIVNGYKAEVNTERIQVPTAFAFMLLFVAALIPLVWLHAGLTPTLVVAALTLVICASLFAGVAMTPGSIGPRTTSLAIASLAAVAVIVAVTYSIHSLPPGRALTVVAAPIAQQMKAQGLIGLLSLLLANVLWMPVDLSTWQRIASVDGEGSALLRSLKRGTLRVLLESPASWLMGVALGIAIGAGGLLPTNADPSSGIAILASKLVTGPLALYLPWFRLSLYAMFLVACIAIMLSTVDSILSAIAFTAFRDVLRHSAEHPERSRRAARWVTTTIVIFGALVYYVLRDGLGANLPTFLYTAYAAQLSLFVVVILALFKRNLNGRAATASVISGIAASIGAFVLAIHSTSPTIAVLPPMFALLGAAFGYVIFYPVPKTGGDGKRA